MKRIWCVKADILLVHLQRRAPITERYVCNQLAKENPYSSEVLDEAWSALALFLKAYPESEYVSIVEEYKSILYQQRARASYDIAVFYDTVAKNPKAALLAYRGFY